VDWERDFITDMDINCRLTHGNSASSGWIHAYLFNYYSALGRISVFQRTVLHATRDDAL
jgi:hypothetical protein